MIILLVGWSGTAGSIDYQTGDFTLQAQENYNYTEYTARIHTSGHSVYRVERAVVTKTEVFTGGKATTKAQSNSLSHLPDTETLSAPELTIDLLPLIEDVLLPGSVVFEWNGEEYFDRDGVLYKNISTETNAGIQVGTIDYSGGVATLAVYPAGALSSATIKAAATLSSRVLG